jgi:HSP20 family molecular chaperone IbpA
MNPTQSTPSTNGAASKPVTKPESAVNGQGAKSTTAGRSAAAEPARDVLQPEADIFEDTDGITVTLDLPGVGSDGLDIHVDRQSLTITGESGVQVPPGVEPIHAEVRSRHYRRSFALSTELEADRTEAELKDGVLTLRIPKRAEVKPRRVEVRTS